VGHSLERERNVWWQPENTHLFGTQSADLRAIGRASV
jgi:hypothetical protein